MLLKPVRGATSYAIFLALCANHSDNIHQLLYTNVSLVRLSHCFRTTCTFDTTGLHNVSANLASDRNDSHLVLYLPDKKNVSNLGFIFMRPFLRTTFFDRI